MKGMCSKCGYIVDDYVSANLDELDGEICQMCRQFFCEEHLAEFDNTTTTCFDCEYGTDALSS